MKNRLFKILISFVLFCCCALVSFLDDAVLSFRKAEFQGDRFIVFAAEADDSEMSGEELFGPENAGSSLAGLDDGFGEEGLFLNEADDGFWLAILILSVFVIAVCISFVCSKIRQLKENKRKRYRYSSERIRSVKPATNANGGAREKAAEQIALPARKRRYEALHAKLEEKNDSNKEDCE